MLNLTADTLAYSRQPEVAWTDWLLLTISLEQLTPRRVFWIATGTAVIPDTLATDWSGKVARAAHDWSYGLRYQTPWVIEVALNRLAVAACISRAAYLLQQP